MPDDVAEVTDSLDKEAGLVGLDRPLDQLDLTKMLAQSIDVEEQDRSEETSPSTVTSADLRIGGPIKTWSIWPSRWRKTSCPRNRPPSRSGGSQRDGGRIVSQVLAQTTNAITTNAIIATMIQMEREDLGLVGSSDIATQ